MKALIASGMGRYADPWHPFERTSPMLAEILRQDGFDVEIDRVESALCRLAEVDLLVVNAGDPWRFEAQESATAPGPARSSLDPNALEAGLERGLGILAMHAATASLRDVPAWAPAIGAIWLPGVSWHPPAGECRISGETLPDGEAIANFTVGDELYCRLQPVGGRQIVAWHTVDEVRHPTAWCRNHGAARIAVDLLGHDEQSYRSEGHRQLVRLLAAWAVTRGS